MKLRPKSSDGSSALHDFLQNYRRITIVEACEYRIDEQDASNIAIWVKESGRWRKLRDVEQRLSRVQFQHDKSACQSIITALFDLSYSQYRTMRESFEQTGFTDAGIYVRDDEDATKDDEEEDAKEEEEEEDEEEEEEKEEEEEQEKIKGK